MTMPLNRSGHVPGQVKLLEGLLEGWVVFCEQGWGLKAIGKHRNACVATNVGSTFIMDSSPHCPPAIWPAPSSFFPTCNSIFPIAVLLKWLSIWLFACKLRKGIKAYDFENKTVKTSRKGRQKCTGKNWSLSNIMCFYNSYILQDYL